MSRPINVRDCGAVGDGVNDDSVAFVAALALARLGSKVIIVPPGAYLFDRQLYVDDFDGLHILGTGMGLSRIVEAESITIPARSSGTLSFHGCADVEVSGLTIVGQGSQGTDAVGNRKALYATDCQNLYVHDVEAANALAEALYVDGNSPRARFHRNYVHDGSLVGVNINSSTVTAPRCEVSDNSIENMGGAHILVAAESVLISRNRCYQPTQQGSDIILLSSAAKNFIVEGNIIHDSDISSADVFPIAIGVVSANPLTGIVAGNLIADNLVSGGAGAIGIRNCAGPVLVTGNVLVGNGTALQPTCPGVRILGASLDKVAVTGNCFVTRNGRQTVGIVINAGTPAGGIKLDGNIFQCDTAVIEK